MKTREEKFLSSQEEYLKARELLAVLAFEEGIIQPRLGEKDRVTFKVMREKNLDFLERVPVYTDNRIVQSLPEVRHLEIQLLTWLVENHPGSYDLIAPVPDEANWLSFGVALATGIPHIQPRRPKGYGVQDEDPIDGRFNAEQTVVTIEGTSSTFGSILINVKRLKIRKLSVPKAHAMFTYEWGSREAMAKEGCEFEPVMTVREAFGIGLKAHRVTQEEHDVVTSYLVRSKKFYRGEHTRDRAETLGLIRAGY